MATFFLIFPLTRVLYEQTRLVGFFLYFLPYSEYVHILFQRFSLFAIHVSPISVLYCVLNTTITLPCWKNISYTTHTYDARVQFAEYFVTRCSQCRLVFFSFFFLFIAFTWHSRCHDITACLCIRAIVGHWTLRVKQFVAEVNLSLRNI